MTGFKYASPYSRVALLAATTNVVFCVCGFVSSFWQIGTEGGLTVGYGLWFRCVDTPVVENDTATQLDCKTFDEFTGQGDKYDSSLRAARGLRYSAFICLCYTAYMGFLYIYANKFHKRWTIISLTIFAFGTVILGIAGLIVYGSSLVLPGFSLSWSFVVAVLTTIFAVPIAVMFTIELIQFGKRKSIVDASTEDVRLEEKHDASVHPENPSQHGVTAEPKKLSVVNESDGEAGKLASNAETDRRGSIIKSANKGNTDDDKHVSIQEPKRPGKEGSVIEPRRQGSVVKPKRQTSNLGPTQHGSKEESKTRVSADDIETPGDSTV